MIQLESAYSSLRSRNHALQQCLMYTRAHTLTYATQFSISESCKPLAVLQFVVRHVAYTCQLALLTKFSDISGLKYAMAPFLAGREIFTKCHQYINLPFDTKPSTRYAGCQLQSDEIPDSRNTHQHAAGPCPRHSSPKCGWRHENYFIVMGNVY